MIDSRYPALSTAIVNSVLWRAGAAVVDALAHAWPASSAAACVAAAERLRGISSVAWIAVAAGAVAFATQFAVPAYVRSGLPIMWPIAAILLLAFIGLSAKSFARAWPHSRLRRLLAPPQLLR